jgi:hypothetical protein
MKIANPIYDVVFKYLMEDNEIATMMLSAILNVEREYYNAITGKKLKIKEDFVEQLSHDLYAIQIPRLKMVAQHELEKILDVFSQHKYLTDNNQVLEFTGDTNNPKVEHMLKKLNMALLDEQILEAMYAEDEVENEFHAQNVKIEKLNQKVEEERKAKVEERKAKEEERKAKEEALEREQVLLQQIVLLRKQNADLLDKK